MTPDGPNSNVCRLSALFYFCVIFKNHVLRTSDNFFFVYLNSRQTTKFSPVHLIINYLFSAICVTSSPAIYTYTSCYLCFCYKGEICSIYHSFHCVFCCAFMPLKVTYIDSYCHSWLLPVFWNFKIKFLLTVTCLRGSLNVLKYITYKGEGRGKRWA